MNAALIGRTLVEQGKKLFYSQNRLGAVKFTDNEEADGLCKDLEKHPHAFVLACLMDRQIKTERAWAIPHQFSQRLGGFSIERLAELSLTDVSRIMSELKPRHRFANMMSGYFHSAVSRISSQYAGDAGRIWSGIPSNSKKR